MNNAYENFWKNIQIRKLESGDRSQLENLIGKIESSNKNEAYWLPITDISREHFLVDEWTVFMGAFLEGEELIGAMGLFFNENEFGESRDVIGLKGIVAEFGRAMVLPDYRGKGIIGRLANELFSLAEKSGIEHLLVTVHPDNKPSWRFFSRIGFEKEGEKNKGTKYPRDILVKHIRSNRIGGTTIE